MNKFKKLYMIILLLISTVSGCGVNKGNPEERLNGSETIIEENEGTDTKKNSEQTADSIIRLLEQNIEFNVNGELTEETAFLKHSDNQGYSFYVLPEYEFTAEEPYKDVVMYSENDHIFMRIEILPSDIDWNYIEESTIAQLNAVNTNVKLGPVPSDEFYANTKVFESNGNGDLVTAYLVKNNELSLKLTLFMPENENYRDPSLKMAKTIVMEN